MGSVARDRNASEQAIQQASSIGNGAGKGGIIPPPMYRWQPGQSGNPTGRSKNDLLAQWIRDQTGGGKELCEFVIAKFRETLPPDCTDVRAKLVLDEQRMEAATWLADRGFAKPKPVEDVEGSAQVGMALFAALLGMDPAVISELNRRLIAQSGEQAIDVPSEEVK